MWRLYSAAEAVFGVAVSLECLPVSSHLACHSPSVEKTITKACAGALDTSKAALYFANAAKRVTMQPMVNEVQDNQAMIRCLQLEIDRLRQQLVRLLSLSSTISK